MMLRTKHAVIAVAVVILVLLGVLFGVMVRKAGGVRFGVEHVALHVAAVYDSYSVLVLGEDKESERISMRAFLIERLGDRVDDYIGEEEVLAPEMGFEMVPQDVGSSTGQSTFTAATQQEVSAGQATTSTTTSSF